MFKKPIEIKNATLLGDWQEVSGIKAESIVKGAGDEILDGIVVKGYEMKFGTKNENGEIYDKNCFDKFIKRYFVDNGLNMVVDRQHVGRDLCGRVIYAESNSVGFYVVAYIPRALPIYNQIKAELENKILQGFSKCGWATDYDVTYDQDGYFESVYIKEMEITSVSLVATPANALPFERVQEIKNALKYENKNQRKKSLFNKKN